jgi:uncharacterized membrane protein (UPF0127 family)
MACERLERLPHDLLPGGLQVYRAVTPHARLLGLALLDEVDPDHALLIQGCRSVHTFGMRFPIDVAFFGRDGEAVWVESELSPRRVAGVLAAVSVLETRAGQAGRFLAAGAGELVASISRPRPRAA